MNFTSQNFGPEEAKELLMNIYMFDYDFLIEKWIFYCQHL